MLIDFQTERSYFSKQEERERRRTPSKPHPRYYNATLSRPD